MQQKFTNLPGGFRGLGLMANYSYNDSHINGLPNRDDSPSLMGTAKHAFNIEPSYELSRYSAHMGMSYNSSNIDAYQYFSNDSGIPSGVCGNRTDPTLRAVNGPSTDPAATTTSIRISRWTRRWAHALYAGLQLQVEGLNLNNEVFGFYNGSPQYMTQREYYKPTYSASLRWTSGREK